MKKLLKITFTLIFTTILLLGFAMPLNPIGNWYQQFMPNPVGGQIRDIYFVDSLLGFAVSDSSILKTTNSGDNWSVKQNGFYIFRRIHFLNSNIGYACAGNNKLLKTSNSGENWIEISLPSIFPFDMSVVSEDSIWLVNTNGLTGGVFRTIDGGANWEPQLNIGSENPEKIYMFNHRIGFISKNMGSSGYVRKTTNGGSTWSLIVNNDYYLNIKFADSFTGWKSSVFGLKKTSDGGLNWVTQTIPSGGIIQNGFIGNFVVINKDTLIGTGGNVLYPNGQMRGIIYRTTNGGNNWLFQVPDTSINIGYAHIYFKDKFKGWIYDIYPRGIHTTTGGDPIWVTGITQISTQVPKEYQLFQNYPNPFNPKTIIRFQINRLSDINISVYDIQGKLITELVKQKYNAGTYEVDFTRNNYSSGIYFYSLIIDGSVIKTKKMILIK